jgi:hypothetical protein
VLNRHQFGQLSEALQRKGGFSINIHTGHEPTSGYMVADFGAERTRPLQTTRGHHIEAYARQHERALTGPNRYLGGWADTGVQPHEAALDRSTLYPETPVGHAQGYTNMVANFQKALYHVTTGKDITNPAQPQEGKVDALRSLRRMRGENVA